MAKALNVSAIGKGLVFVCGMGAKNHGSVRGACAFPVETLWINLKGLFSTAIRERNGHFRRRGWEGRACLAARALTRSPGGWPGQNSILPQLPEIFSVVLTEGDCGLRSLSCIARLLTLVLR